ncbi:MAG: hypothetical protein R3F38_17380 [Gammaproteobacteria bacterium]
MQPCRNQLTQEALAAAIADYPTALAFTKPGIKISFLAAILTVVTAIFVPLKQSLIWLYQHCKNQASVGIQVVKTDWQTNILQRLNATT